MMMAMQNVPYLHIGNAYDLPRGRERLLYRLLEMVPGVLALVTLALMVVCSWKLPVVAAVFIIVFDVYWFFKTVFLSLYLRIAFRRMREAERTDWIETLEHASGNRYRDIYHLIILPMYREPYEIVRDSLRALAGSRYPKERFLVVLSGEGRAANEAQEVFARLGSEFQNAFGAFMTTVHSADVPGELAGKGANETWAAKQAKEKIIDARGVPYDDILVTVLDADTQIGPGYFGRVTHAFLTSAHPYRSSYQPIPLFLNNIHQAPALARVISFSATFWHLLQQARQHRLTTFSSHSMPFAPLVEIGFWQTNIVSEDSRIFWQCYLAFDGDWRVEPLYYTVSMDANVAPTFWKTAANQYRQQRRWGYGVENIPYLLYGFLKNKRIPFGKKVEHAFHKIEAFHSWATNSLLIFALGWLPVVLGGEAFSESVLSFNLPEITRLIMALASIGIITSAVMSVVILMPKPAWFRARHYVLYIIQWALLPLTMIIFGAFPAIDAQVRLMLGRYMGFWFTPKYRKADSE